jgi:peroxiredoxin
MPVETPPDPVKLDPRNPFHEKRIAALAFTGILLTVFYVVGTLARWGSPRLLPPGEPLPAFTVSARDGSPVHPHVLRGENSVLLFFTVDCPHCKAMIRSVRELGLAMREHAKFYFVSLSPRSEVVSRGVAMEYDSTLYFMDADLARRTLHIETVPVTLLVDGMGVLQEEIVGERPAVVLQRTVARAFVARHGE